MSGQRREDPCEEFDRCGIGGEVEGARQTRWRAHLAGCADCREQVRADALLRGSLAAPAPALAAGFGSRLRRRLEERLAKKPATAGRWGRRLPGSGRPGLGRTGLERSGWSALAAYGTAAAVAAAVILSRLPWGSITLSPVLGITLGAVALLSPLVLLDRIGIVRPPG